ncbi:hypothetical protein SEUCBS140593_004047 [Sporothrix eucalyptigena]|uniref:BZIP domain-containing protein n=1 Tax=Sporothrix eucalyptigena TaxID=1812306 RepID=A0ABP0BJR7_9PEZI
MEVSRPKKRSIDFLTPDQLRRKREGNVKAQRALREKRKAEMEALQQQNRDLEAKLLAAQSTLAMAQEQMVNLNLANTDVNILPTHAYPTTPTFHTLRESDMGMPCAVWDGGDLVATEATLMVDPSLPADMWSSQQFIPPSMPPSIPFMTIPTDEVWSIIPKHTAPVCIFDHAILNLIHQRRPQDNAPEFQKHIFPSVQSLLNHNSPRGDSDSDDDDEDTEKFPVSSTIVRNLRVIMTLSGFPEQIAMLQNVSAIVRWLIAPTRSNYDAMPLYLRPTATQLVVPHPPWIDVIPWAAARDWFCRRPLHMGLHNYTLFSTICNETLSLNWPYQDGDILLPVGDWKDILLNPIFGRHNKTHATGRSGPRWCRRFRTCRG